MSRRPAKFTQADLRRALREAKRENMTVEISPEGKMLVVPLPPETSKLERTNPWD